MWNDHLVKGRSCLGIRKWLPTYWHCCAWSGKCDETIASLAWGLSSPEPPQSHILTLRDTCEVLRTLQFGESSSSCVSLAVLCIMERLVDQCDGPGHHLQNRGVGFCPAVAVLWVVLLKGEVSTFTFKWIKHFPCRPGQKENIKRCTGKEDRLDILTLLHDQNPTTIIPQRCAGVHYLEVVVTSLMVKWIAPKYLLLQVHGISSVRHFSLWVTTCLQAWVAFLCHVCFLVNDRSTS